MIFTKIETLIRNFMQKKSQVIKSQNINFENDGNKIVSKFLKIRKIGLLYMWPALTTIDQHKT